MLKPAFVTLRKYVACLQPPSWVTLSEFFDRLQKEEIDGVSCTCLTADISQHSRHVLKPREHSLLKTNSILIIQLVTIGVLYSPSEQVNGGAFSAIAGLFENGIEEETATDEKEEEEQCGEEDKLYFSDSENSSSKDEEHLRNGDLCGGVKIEHQEGEEREDRVQSDLLISGQWDGPNELKVVCEGGERRIYSCQALILGTTWGPFPGKIEPVTGGNEKVSLVVTGAPRWLMDITWVSAEDEKCNCSVYSRANKKVITREPLTADYLSPSKAAPSSSPDYASQASVCGSPRTRVLLSLASTCLPLPFPLSPHRIDQPNLLMFQKERGYQHGCPPAINESLPLLFTLYLQTGAPAYSTYLEISEGPGVQGRWQRGDTQKLCKGGPLGNECSRGTEAFWDAVKQRCDLWRASSRCLTHAAEGRVWCSTTKNIFERDELAACVVDFQSPAQPPYGPGMYPSRQLDAIQLLPQQEAMASILPNAIINKDIFPCKTCGIWFRSERNLQAHLMYYCSGRQREPEVVADQNANSAQQMLRNCTYPHCDMSFAGSHALEMHLSTHHSVKSDETSPGGNLKCTICNYSAETLMALQHHIISHLSKTGLRCSHCQFSFQSPRDIAKHQELHGHSEAISNNFIKEDKAENTLNLITKSPRKIIGFTNIISDLKESSGQHNSCQNSDPESMQISQQNKCDGISGKKSNLSQSRVKSEPSSPRLASSPIQHHLPPAFSLPPLIPHIPFSQDITVGPQASEILAKMSELVHRRLHHGGNAYPPVMYNTLLPKGASCFECSISFNNLDNYLVHKKHYCNSRWENTRKTQEFPGLLEKQAGNTSPKIGDNLAIMLNASYSSEWKGQETKTFNPISSGKTTEELSVKVNNASGAHEMPNGMPPDPQTETDPSHTTCDACKITFSRHETYMVHKQFYCATRHDPQVRRANNKGPANQKAVRPRKRRKAYELATPEQEHISPMGMPPFFGMPSIGGSQMSKDTLDSLKDHQRYTMIQGLVPKYPEASLTAAKSTLVSKCNTTLIEESEAPIDLSKKCSPTFGNSSDSPKRLLDYHECVVCKISFNKVEDYLKHKQSSCPGTNLHSIASQNKGLKKGSPRYTTNLLDHTLFERQGPQVKIEIQMADTQACKEDQLTPRKADTTSQLFDGYPSPAKKSRPNEQIWPYYEIKATDYATGMLGSQSEQRQSPNEGSEGEKDQTMPDGSANNNPRMSSGFKDLMEDVENDSHTPESHLDESCNESTALMPSLKIEEDSSSFKKVLNGSILSNIKYCRPCDIKFNNLSNFITHKKFYCSSHAAEHVK
ncbi:hypothetical protein DNTS_018332 [Danionella cerebrum]|uniref:C2H2-type domain-containing protein n=1 Tax=Danionella cerebrum TaxID=2873325 RepID=A0A553R0S8_9TELE|nr:hypothetical protein DNTS_018332 [Danionella translucida]